MCILYIYIHYTYIYIYNSHSSIHLPHPASPHLADAMPSTPGPPPTAAAAAVAPPAARRGSAAGRHLRSGSHGMMGKPIGKP